MFGKIFHSTLPENVTRNLGEFYLGQARTEKKQGHFEVALALYDQVKEALMSLGSVKEALRKAQNPQTLADETVRAMMADAYFERGEILEDLKSFDKARASYLKAEKWGREGAKHRVEASLSLPSGHSAHSSSSGWGRFRSPSSSVPTPQLSVSAAFVAPVSHLREIANIGLEPPILEAPALQFFRENLTTPVMKDALPAVGARPKDLQQLADALTLLSLQAQKNEAFEKIELADEARAWLHDIERDGAEVKRLYSLATDVIRVFVDDELKALSVAEVVVLASGLTKELFNTLLKRLINGIQQSTLLETDLLNGLAEMIYNAAPEYLDADDLVKILEVVSERLQKTHGQSEDHLYHLTYALARILDAMADYVKDVDRERLREPLLSYLKSLQGSSNPYLVYQAAYACQALAYVPDDETPWQGAVRRGSSILKGVSGLVSAVKGFDLNQIVESLGNIYDGVGGAGGIVETVGDVYQQVKSLAEGGQDFVSCLKEGLTFDKKETWYKALEGVDVLLQQRKLSDFEEFVRQASCRQHKAFQWGLSERLGQLAANPELDKETQQGALRFLEDLYGNDAQWGTQAFAKKRVIQIIRELAIGSPIAEEAGKLLARLAYEIDSQKRAFYESCLKDAAAGPYPLYKRVLATSSPTLLERAQNTPKVEDDLRQLKRERLKEWKKDERLYVRPQGKANFHDIKTFDLTDEVNKFLNSADKKILLLLGDSGAGKSTFNCALEADLWNAYLKDPKNPAKDRIPLLIALPEIDNPTHELVEKYLHLKGFSQKQMRELKSHHEFVFILDSYDESQQSKNLYLSNKINQEGGWQGQVIIGCRSEYFGEDDRARFAPADATQLQEIVVAPFSETEIKRYTEAYAKANPLSWTAERYQDVLKSIPNLKELVTNPFLLKITLDVLPGLENQEHNLSTAGLTRMALYDQFVEQWFERAKQRFLREKTLEGQEKKVFEELIDEGFTKNGIAFVKKLAVQLYERQKGNPVVKYVRFEDQETWKADFFGSEDEKRLLREAWPLSRNKDRYQFIHKSLLEYFIARAVFEPGQSELIAAEMTGSSPQVKKRARRLSFESQYSLDERTIAVEQGLLDSPLARKNFVSEPAVIGFLAERAQKEPLFKKQLLAVIERSKTIDKDLATHSLIRKAAANAITVLVKAGIQFNRQNLQKIQVPGADLSGGMFDHAQLQGADLRHVKLQNTWLREANLSGAQMAGVQFGEWPFLEEDSQVGSCAYSLDGTACAVGLSSGNISVYATSNWAKIRTLSGHRGALWSVAYSPKNDQIAAGGQDKKVRLWDVTTGACRYTLSGHSDEVTSVAYSPKGDQVVSGGDKTVRLWDVETGAALHILSGHRGKITSVAYAPKEEQIASGSEDNTVRLWDIESGACRYTLRGHDDEVTSVVYSPQGEQLASGSDDNTVRLWDVKTGACQYILSGHNYPVTSVAYSPKGDQIASGSHDKTVRLWDVATGIFRRTLSGHSAWVRSVAYAPKGDQIASGSNDGTVRLWDVEIEVGHTLSGHSGEVNSVVYAPIGEQLASGSEDNTVRLWDLETGVCRHTLSGYSVGVPCVFGITSVAYSPQGDQLAAGSWDDRVRLWDIATGACRHTLIGHRGTVFSVAYSPTGEQLASGSEDKSVRLWDAKTGTRRHTLKGHRSDVKSVVYSPTGEQLASGSEDKTVRLWDVATGVCRYTLKGHKGNVNSVVYSPTGEQLASGSEDKTVRLWDVETGTCRHTLKGHKGDVNSVMYSPKGEQLASGSEDKTVRLWQVESGHCQMVLEGCNGSVMSVAWKEASAAGHYLVTGSGDKAVRQWQVIKAGDQYKAFLCWSSTHDVLTAKGTLIENVQGLSEINEQLLKQRGAVLLEKNKESVVSAEEGADEIASDDEGSWSTASDNDNESVAEAL
ncbi:pentapeptide repeat-containing protein [Mycoavidus sp. SF9855]|uniref:WD40 domain-containing protein n=1 Tax=Mycoavidus sp. SF9855 TaxID=2968475 RepID=UPI00211B9C67|nr:pentapeptide repeat-containing protein [Mycoavidus sp. SF9855]UUM22293.1 pentapeptide repeat-containing protein [Mycoavidus sp. SF9855]